jgi:hypothetical protein
MSTPTATADHAATGPAALPWTGWHRPTASTQWRAVCQAASEAEAWDRLAAEAPAGDPLTVLPRGWNANEVAVGRG